MNESVVAFTGMYRDPVAAGYPLGNGYRWYLPPLMRFSAPDSASPFGAGGVNPYVYCAGDPINRLDPSGHTPEGEVVESAENGVRNEIGSRKRPADRPLGAPLAKSQKAGPKVKRYVVLYRPPSGDDDGHGDFVVGIKNTKNPDGTPAFGGGFPSFFGGSAEGVEQPEDTLRREVEEESRKMLSFNGPAYPLFPKDFETNGTTYSFYWSPGWTQTAGDLLHPPSATTDAEKEMSEYRTVSISAFGDTLPGGRLKRLLSLTGVQSGPSEVKRFSKTYTAKAFNRFINLALKGELPGEEQEP
ncbi:hypothetical protein CAL14_12450 [Bordetella genomosp. 9]|uniref:RHS repeat-associated core domain-containing protein n=1 Tax=Bordetella genomosp. 9 TaxID=1416803 RepID=UPI000A28E296|nr:RHS repeat-associated core domain-containing protein [Bordetella genomosp. 9]ARP91001.1 hypothetical protein CAL14_12450 [Bordetella genomosp. 9]